MLQLILGIAGTGKTTELLNRMEQRAKAGQRSIFVVPEQFSSSAEVMVYKVLGDTYSALVQVASFRTLAERVLKTAGGIEIPVLSDAARAVCVRRALDALGGEVRTFACQRRNAAFCALCADTINELKTAGATPGVLRRVGAQTGEDKLTELALIFEAYEVSISNVAMDPQDRLGLAAQRAGDEYFEGMHCFLDNFDGFTSPEYKLLRQMLRCAEGVSVALCCDGLAETSGGLGLFSPVRRCAARLFDEARTAGTATAAPRVLSTLRRTGAAGLTTLNMLFACDEEPKAPQSEGLTLTECETEWEECRLAAAQMHALACQGVPYSRMAVVCRNVEEYESGMRRAFALFDIPYFVDAPTTIEYTPPVAFMRAALRLLREGVGSVPVLALLKTGLCGYTESEIAALENYVYTWSPRAEEWRRPFENNPAGLLQPQDEAAQQALVSAEKLRGEVVPKLEGFVRRGRKNTVEQLSKNLYFLMDKFDAPKHADEMVARLREQGEVAYADKSRRAWDVAMGLLDEMAALAGGEALDAGEYDELFLLLVRATDFGQAPQVLECAIFTSAGRMRLADPQYCFVLGVAEGMFPMQVGYSGLLTHTDREALVNEGLELPGSFENRVLLEEMFLYRALTSAREGLYVSWPVRFGGAPKSMAAALQRVWTALAPPPLALPLALQAATPGAAFDALAVRWRDNTGDAAALYKALRQRPENEGKLRLLRAVDNSGTFAIQDGEAIRRVVGSSMSVSATRAEQYYNCHFAYYMERVLRARPRRRAEVSPTESGTFVHHVLERVLAEAGGGFRNYTDEAVTEAANRHADAFIGEFLLPATRRAAHLLGRIKGVIVQLLCFMRDGAAVSDFEVDALELPIGDKAEGVQPLTVTTPAGRTIRVSGVIDRVDALKCGGKTYICVVDYKTGSKEFRLEDVYCGLNMQMLIYMDALLKNAKERYPDAVPAGVLYLKGDPAPKTGPRTGEEGPVFKMDGLLLRDEEVLRAMDYTGEGVFVPVGFKKDGMLKAGKQLASLQKIGRIARHVNRLVAEMADGVYDGNFAARPQVRSNTRPCDWCAYRAACRHEDGRNETAIRAPEGVFEQEEEGAEHG
jgi:ATP-dependent helicase/nuclease subunit B